MTAESRQPASFDPMRETISALAALGATDRWIMTAALAAVGVCHVITALGLRTSTLSGRTVLAVGGLATVLVSALPLPTDASAHGVAAAVAFGSLAVWPALSGGRVQPSGAASMSSAAVLLLLVAGSSSSSWSTAGSDWLSGARRARKRCVRSWLW